MPVNLPVLPIFHVKTNQNHPPRTELNGNIEGLKAAILARSDGPKLIKQQRMNVALDGNLVNIRIFAADSATFRQFQPCKTRATAV